MSGRLLAAGLGLALGVHLLGMQITPHFGRYVDVFLVVTVLNAVGGSSLGGMLGGLLGGWLFEALTGGLYGLFGFSNTVVGYATARVAQRLETQRPASMVLMLALAALGQQLILVLLLMGLQPQAELPRLDEVAIRVVTTAVLGLAAWILIRRTAARRADRRQQRRSRLRLG